MLEKRRHVIRGLVAAGMRRTGTAAKWPTLTHRSIASVPHGTKGVLARRDRRRASCAIRAAHRWHCTDARHGTVRTHPLQVCLAAADKAPIGFAHGRHRSRAGASAACAAGMDSPCKGIFFRTRMAVMDWVGHAAAGGAAAGGRTMKRREAGETRSCGPAWPEPGRQGLDGHSPGGAETVGSTPRYRERPGDRASCRAAKRGAGRFGGRRGGVGGARRVRSGGVASINRKITNACRGLRTLRGGSARCRLMHDNGCYHASIR